MRTKKYYITKKQVHEYIERTLKNFDSIEGLRNEVSSVLEELNEYAEDNKGQIKFFTRVKEQLN